MTDQQPPELTAEAEAEGQDPAAVSAPDFDDVREGTADAEGK